MKLMLPIFGVIFAASSCCCFGDNPFAENGIPKPVQPLQTATAATPDGDEVPGLGAGGSGDPTTPGPAPVDPPSEQPSVPPPPTPPAPGPVSAPSKPDIGALPAPASRGTHEGILVTGSSTLVVIKTTAGPVPPVGATGTLSKWVSKKIMGADVTMWLNIANVTVKSVDATSVTLTVNEVTFDTTVNGEKVDPFEKGVKTQLEWTK